MFSDVLPEIRRKEEVATIKTFLKHKKEMKKEINNQMNEYLQRL